jgi:hypothetical protein
MPTNSLSRAAPTIKFELASWVATEPVPRDRAQSQRLHEPEYRSDTIDLMTGENIRDIEILPSVADGNLPIYFATESNRKAYVGMPLNHPIFLSRSPLRKRTIVAAGTVGSQTCC